MNIEIIEQINGKINNFIWGPVMLVLLVGTGIFLTIRVHFFQISHIKLWMKGTFGLIFKKHTPDENITPFQAVSTALASTVGTGNIVGVTTAIVSGGAGAFAKKFVPIMCIFYIIVGLLIIIQLGRGFGVYSKFSSILFWYVR